MYVDVIVIVHVVVVEICLVANIVVVVEQVHGKVLLVIEYE